MAEPRAYITSQGCFESIRVLAEWGKFHIGHAFRPARESAEKQSFLFLRRSERRGLLGETAAAAAGNAAYFFDDELT